MSDNWREVSAVWIGNSEKGDAFMGYNQAGGSIQIGHREGQPGIGPMEMLLLGLAGCTGMDITSILRKQRQDLQKFEIRVRGNRATTYPMVYTDIEVTYLLWGTDLNPKSVEQAIVLSEEKYCSVGIMLGAMAKIISSYRILAPDETLEKV